MSSPDDIFGLLTVLWISKAFLNVYLFFGFWFLIIVLLEEMHTPCFSEPCIIKLWYSASVSNKPSVSLRVFL